MQEENKVSFSVNGEFITKLAREKCYYEGRFDYSVELLTSCLQSNELSKNEIHNMALAILDGRAVLKGMYPSEDYGFFYLDEKDSEWDLGKLVSDRFSENAKLKEEYSDLQQKYLFVLDQMEDWEKKSLNKEYKLEYGEPLFEGYSSQSELPSSGNEMLDSFVKRQLSDTEDDYGWLEPNGTFHPVDWGLHQIWADEWMQKNLSDEEYIASDDIISTAGDYLTKRGWVLMHNP